jgi:hypothetical protein
VSEPRLHLKPALERNQISIEQLVRSTAGKVARTTVLRMYCEPVRRVDLDCVSAVLNAMTLLAGKKISFAELLVEI